MRLTAMLAALGSVAVAGIAGLVVILAKSRRDPVERERRRRVLVEGMGRMGDGFITDFTDDTVYYSYTAGGVEYTASQEISAVRGVLPDNLASLIGPVTVKFLTSSPENSIIASERWSGIRGRERRSPLRKGA